MPQTFNYDVHTKRESWQPFRAMIARMQQQSEWKRLPLLFLFLVVFFFPISSASALQPAFIRGTVFSAYDNSIINNALLKTSTGLTYKIGMGSFSLRLPPGIYNIIVEAPGFIGNCVGGVWATPGATAVVNMWLIPSSSPTCVLRGKLLSIDAFEPIANGIITVDRGGLAVTSDNGEFSMIVPSGIVILSASASGFTTKTTRPITLRPGRTERVLIYLSPKHSDTTSVTGLIKNQCTGEKIDAAFLFTHMGTAVSDNSGTFSLPLESGASTVIATAPGYQYDVHTAWFSSYYPSIISVGLLPSKKGFGLIWGTIINNLDGTPCADVKIVSNTGAISYSDASGQFRLYTSVCTTYITVSGNYYIQKKIPVSVSPGLATGVTIFLDPQSSSPVVQHPHTLSFFENDAMNKVETISDDIVLEEE
ncbi:MAG: carboxypeptidase-like regulatory domain-containing protein [Desulfobacterota bacterium]|nr:carboxypeptidase-like regulatory domain-containing protein [Thermodesulfobacteriota bacterium]